MNKIYSEQIQKAKTLSQGIKTNDVALKEKGINPGTEKIDATAHALEEAAKAQDEAEEKLREQRKIAHKLLADLKELCNAAKQPIKERFPLEQWQKFGIADKR